MDWILKNKKTPGGIAPKEGERKRKNISRGEKTKTLLMVLFLAFGFFSASAGMVKADSASDAATAAAIAAQQATLDKMNSTAGAFSAGVSASNAATTTSATAGTSYYQNHGALANTSGQMTYAQPTGQNTAFTCPLANFDCYFKTILLGVLNLAGFIFAIATTLFAWVVKPENVSGPNGMLNKQAVLDVWIMVRDLLNMTFILILLFAAFCTIFQVDKWNLKKVWLNILINALLVNFSFPIARFFIDISNVAFYYFLNHLFSASAAGTSPTGSSIFASFGDASNIGKLLTPGNYTQYNIAYLVAMIVVVFIIGMTLMVIAGLFVVRLIALTMIVMFSPVGFVGYIFPATSKYADQWWSNLFSYSFFAPIMIFVMAIALNITNAMGKENMQSFISSAGVNSTAPDANWISQAAFLAIPIIILWMGIGIAKKFGIEGADTVVGAVKKGGKALAMKMSGANYLKKNYDGFTKERKKRQEEIDKKRWGSSTGKWLNDKQDLLYEKSHIPVLSSRAAKRRKSGINTALDEDVKKATEGYDGETTTALKTHLATNHAAALDPKNRKAGIEYMAKYKQLISDPVRKQEHEAGVRQAALLTANANPAVMAAAADPVAKAAAIEAHIQQQIASSYGTYKTQYQQVKAAHSKA